MIFEFEESATQNARMKVVGVGGGGGNAVNRMIDERLERRRVHLGQHRRAGAAHVEVRCQNPDREKADARTRRRRAPRDRASGDRRESRRSRARARERGPRVHHLRHGRRHGHRRGASHRRVRAGSRRADGRHRHQAVPVRGTQAHASGGAGYRRHAQERRHDDRRAERAAAGRGREGHSVPGRAQEGR